MIGFAMAGANLPAKKYSKKSPTITRLAFEFQGSSTQFIDIARALSILNRKFYRQGVYYYVNSIELYNNTDGFVDIHTLPDNWITKNAWNRGFSIWNKMHDLVQRPLTQVSPARYRDFKIYMSDLHRTTGSKNPALYGINETAATNGMAPDEWAYSQFVSADDDQDATAQADNFYVHMIGGHVGTATNWESIGLIKSYAESRREIELQGDVGTGTTTSPDSNAINDPLLNIFDFSSEEQLNDLMVLKADENDYPPYDRDLYLGNGTSHMLHVARLVTTVNSGRVVKHSGFCAPFGLICVDPPASLQSTDKFRIVLNLAVGTYHGVYAERA
jgi:hypothetical protein